LRLFEFCRPEPRKRLQQYCELRRDEVHIRRDNGPAIVATRQSLLPACALSLSFSNYWVLTGGRHATDAGADPDKRHHHDAQADRNKSKVIGGKPMIRGARAPVE
jgi:hypothetical protein